jgi:hypothetical protein
MISSVFIMCYRMSGKWVLKRRFLLASLPSLVNDDIGRLDEDVQLTMPS